MGEYLDKKRILSHISGHNKGDGSGSAVCLEVFGSGLELLFSL